MSAISRGIETDKRFLSDLLPTSEYDQTVFLNNGYYAIECVKKNRTTMHRWNQFIETIKIRFDDKLKEVYSITSDGVHFIIYIDM